VAKKTRIHKPQVAQRFRELQSSRLKLHRLQPPRPLRDARATAAFVKERRIVMSTGRSSLPVLAEAIAGEPIAGSWMAHPAVYHIYRILGGLSRYNLPAAPLILGKETILDPSLGPAVERIAADRERQARARVQLPPLARRLLDEVEARGRVRMDHWGVRTPEARRARLLLERQLLVVSSSIHTEGGYHTAVVAPWSQGKLSRRFRNDAARSTLSAAVDQVLLASVRSAVLVPEREVRRWLIVGAERVKTLLQEGKLERLPGPGGFWLTSRQ